MKVLIWDKDIPLSDSGGPAGYLYNIHEYLKVHPDSEIIFYSDVFPQRKKGGRLRKIFKILTGRLPIGVLWDRLLRSFTPSSPRERYQIYSYYYAAYDLSEAEIQLMASVDFIHFHLLTSFLRAEWYLRKIRAKSILTTHSPEPFIAELEAGSISIAKLLKRGERKKRYIEREAFAYKSADYIMFPVPYAEEVYTSYSEILRKTLTEINAKKFYVPTAISTSPTIDQALKKEYSRQLQYPVKVCFIGRHNNVKGYDKLQEIALKCWEKRPDIHFIIGGKEEPLTRLEDPKWIELGWIKTTALLENVDLFVLPNKQTYFDLILLEVIRQGVPCVISATGGNKWFLERNIPGIRGYEYDDTSAAADLIVQMAGQIGTPEWSEMKDSCMTAFRESFTLDKYIEGYLTQLQSLLLN